MPILESFEALNDCIEIDNEISEKSPLIAFYEAEPSGKILYVNENKIFEIYKKYLSLNTKSKYNSLIPSSLDRDMISFEKLAINLISEDNIYEIASLYELRDRMLEKSLEDESEIYINMPICTHGKIIKKAFSKKITLLAELEDSKTELNVLVHDFSIEKEKMFIDKNEIYILGTVASLEKTISIDVGAILI